MRPVAITTWIPAARAARSAAVVRGRSTPSSQVSVRSRSHAIAATSRGKPSGRVSSSTRRRTRRRRRFPARSGCPRTPGIAPWPLVTRSTVSATSGCESSRFGPTVPVEPAASSVWQPPQPAEAKIWAPFEASPSTVDGGVSSAVVASGSVPTIVSGVGLTSSPPPQPARPADRASRASRSGGATHRFRA